MGASDLRSSEPTERAVHFETKGREVRYDTGRRQMKTEWHRCGQKLEERIHLETQTPTSACLTEGQHKQADVKGGQRKIMMDGGGESRGCRPAPVAVLHVALGSGFGIRFLFCSESRWSTTSTAASVCLTSTYVYPLIRATVANAILGRIGVPLPYYVAPLNAEVKDAFQSWHQGNRICKAPPTSVVFRCVSSTRSFSGDQRLFIRLELIPVGAQAQAWVKKRRVSRSDSLDMISVISHCRAFMTRTRSIFVSATCTLFPNMHDARIITLQLIGRACGADMRLVFPSPGTQTGAYPQLPIFKLSNVSTRS
ncbi:hypothetical protein CVT26_008652 [Gymnopilus dilepis]|uniref:Uncharacterized protein n=1 Tax=Gymnopilus dilepis TaxID=231916 RepID=A0A409XY19_9AGAR|nr:hypothetical protein CVT26_008652 [Gymnopilus dilepis]